MSFAMTRNDALSGLLGGAMIGTAAGILLLFNGDVMGASGIVTSTTLNPIKALQAPQNQWKYVFMASFVLTSHFAAIQAETPTLSIFGYALAGFLVGMGTKLGNGCTSGHGICGLPRLSKRSLVSVLTFMTTGAITTVLSKGLFLASNDENTEKHTPFSTVVAVVALGAAMLSSWRHRKETAQMAKSLPAIAAGGLFAKGLQISGMAYPSKVWGFLDVTSIADGNWNPQLALVMGGGVLISFWSYQHVAGYSVINTNNTLPCPLTQEKDKSAGFCNLPSSQKIDTELILGAALFGIGWGVAGMCPGPALVLAANGVSVVLLHWMPAFWFGSFLANEYKTRKTSV